MAKEQLHQWSRTILIALTIAFAGGGYAMKIHSNSSAIAGNSKDIKVVTGSVHKIELKQAEDIALKKEIGQTLLRLESKVDASCKEQTQIKLDVATTKIKVDTLTRDE